MRNERIDGIGSIYGGEYEQISVDGIGKLKGDARARIIQINGLFKGKGRLEADQIIIDGISRLFRDVKGKEVKINGIMKLRNGRLHAEQVYCQGVLVCNQEVNADEVFIDGLCSIKNLYGENILIRYRADSQVKAKLPRPLRLFSRLYFGRKVSLSQALADTVECTSLKASGLKSKVVRAHQVELSGHCQIGTLYCDGDVKIDPTCKIKKIVSNEGTKTTGPESKNRSGKQEGGQATMDKQKLADIMNLYRDGKIDLSEAQTMIGSLLEPGQAEASRSKAAPAQEWPDDGRLRIVAYRGLTLLKRSDPDSMQLQISLEGDVSHVDCTGNLTCGDIGQQARAGGSITCRDINGNVACGGNVTCKEINGQVKAGGSVQLQS